MLSLLAGLAVGSLAVSPPDTAVTGLGVLGSLALPLALLCVGASLHVDLPTVDVGATGAVVALKVVFMPALAWLVFSISAVDDATFAATVVLFGTPTAVSTYVFADRLGGDATFASLNVFVTTLVSLVTLIVLIALVA